MKQDWEELSESRIKLGPKKFNVLAYADHVLLIRKNDEIKELNDFW